MGKWVLIHWTDKHLHTRSSLLTSTNHNVFWHCHHWHLVATVSFLTEKFCYFCASLQWDINDFGWGKMSLWQTFGNLNPKLLSEVLSEKFQNTPGLIQMTLETYMIKKWFKIKNFYAFCLKEDYVGVFWICAGIKNPEQLILFLLSYIIPLSLNQIICVRSLFFFTIFQACRLWLLLDAKWDLAQSHKRLDTWCGNWRHVSVPSQMFSFHCSVIYDY